MNKRIIIIIVVILVLCILLFFGIKVKPVKENGKLLFDFLNQEEFDTENIESVEYIRYTEGGDNTITYTDSDNIKSMYNSVKNIRVGKETNRACEDNTTVYIFNMKDNTQFKVEIECDWVVIGNKRYNIVKD